jgi:hypothetical protein
MNRALLVGINAYPTAPLRGCLNDIDDMAAFLTTDCGFEKADIRMIKDASATKSGILEALGSLTAALNAGDRVVFHYSGHGAQMPDNTKVEPDGLDEIICPVDFDWTDGTAIRDNELHDVLKSVPPGVEFIWISDSCHSGDLERVFPNDFIQEAHVRIKRLLPPDGSEIETKINELKEHQRPVRTFVSTPEEWHLALVAACQSDQTAADASFKTGIALTTRPNGALTYCLLQILREHRDADLQQLAKLTTTQLASLGYQQEPELSGPAIITNAPFLASLKA